MPKPNPIRDLRNADPNRRADALAAHAIEQIVGQQTNPLFAAALGFMRPVLHDHLRKNLGPRALPDLTRAMRSAQQKPQTQQQEAPPCQKPAGLSRDAALNTMGLKEGANKEEISAAYRSIATLYHPDKFMDKPAELQRFAEKKMVELNAAYQLLKGGTK